MTASDDTKEAITLAPLPLARRGQLRNALAEAGLPHADIAENGRTFFAGEFGGITVGYIGLEVHGKDALLRSLVVVEAERGRGFGSALVGKAIAAAAAEGADRVWVLTTTAAGFLQGRGFTRVAREAAPAAIRATAEFASLCPATAVCLTRTTA
ncbi:MAG: GNAT family N-acetyltransferase [Rhodospirillales bacterium]|nr:MAG: GNAT family N-acetyltransferase [Rhodospirillales bacterium]